MYWPPVPIANVSETLAEKLGLPRQYRSIGIITADSDDVTYCALDEATKAAAVEVVYGRSLYAGAGNASSTKLAGGVIGILGRAQPGGGAIRPAGLRRVYGQRGGLPLRQRGRLHRLFCPHRLPHGHLSVPRRRACGRVRPWPTGSPRLWRRWWGWTRRSKASDVELAALFEPPSGDQLRRRAPHRHPERVQRRLRRLCRGGKGGGGPAEGDLTGRRKHVGRAAAGRPGDAGANCVRPPPDKTR